MPELSFIPRVPVFDANVRVGDAPGALSPCPTPGELLAEMARHGVERAVIYHAQTELRSPTEGNRRLEEWLDPDGRLTPQWSILPVADSLRQVQELHAAGRARAPDSRQMLQRQIDALVYELYGLTEDEVRIVEETTR